MNRTSVVACLASTFCYALLVAGCASQPPAAGADGVWTGADTSRQFDFNAPGNWSPKGVPTGTATIATATPPAPFVNFSEATTTLAAINLTSGLGVTIDGGRTVTLTGGGLSICCDAKAAIYGTLTGNLNLGTRATPSTHQVNGGGTINGNITQTGGYLHPGSSGDNRTLTVNGTYVQGANGALLIDVWQQGAGVLQLTGNASLGGPLAIYVNEGVTGPIAPFKVLTAAAINGCVTQVFVVSPYTATFKCNAQDVTVTLTRH